MRKKLFLIAFGIGIVGFVGMFAVAWFTRPTPAAQSPPVADAEQAMPAAEEDSLAATMKQISMLGTQPQQVLTDRQLQMLIFDIREKIKEYKLKLHDLDIQEKRLLVAQDALKKDIENMASLRVDLASSVASLKAEQQKLLKSTLEVEKAEQQNLISIAETYNVMDPEVAGKILLNMIKNTNAPGGSDDAVKILYYMTERAKAKTLASIASAEPNASVYICQRLKRMVTKE